MGFEAEFGDKVREEFIENALGCFEGIGDVSVSEEEVLEVLVSKILLASVLSNTRSGLHGGT